MNLKFTGSTQIKLKRVAPKHADYCKLSVFANVLNHLGYREKFGETLTPEFLLEKLNSKRKSLGTNEIDPVKVVVPSRDLNSFYKATRLGATKSLSGTVSYNIKLWKDLIREGALLAPDHQMLYGYLKAERSFEFVSKGL